jgi:NADH-quinone oxidoreductase subunit J
MSAFPASGVLLAGIFILFVATTAAGALIAALSRRVMRSVCGLALCCLGLAGLYYFLNSPFLALMEILIYVGAVCVTMVFAVMLAEPEETVPTEKSGASYLWGACAVAVGTLIFWGLWHVGTAEPLPPPASRLSDGSVETIGKALLTTYSMAFELISLVLLVAILGALAIARPGRSKA